MPWPQEKPKQTAPTPSRSHHSDQTVCKKTAYRGIRCTIVDREAGNSARVSPALRLYLSAGFLPYAQEATLPSRRFFTLLVPILAAVFQLLTTAAPIRAASLERVLYDFKGGRDGLSPSAVIFDAAGNLYGATYNGGDSECNCGTVFKLEPAGQGKWRKAVLHTFVGQDGTFPTDLILDASGSLYGMTVFGGGLNYGYGTVFKLAPGANGMWTHTILHIFTNLDGSQPSGSLTFDAAGNLYGTTQAGGEYGFGTVFKLTPGADDNWTEGVLHSFNGNDGNTPTSAVIFDSFGDLYGTTASGGNLSSCHGVGCGTVFELVPGTDGKWIHKVLHSFDRKDGDQPWSSLVFDAAGNLYGTTVLGGDIDSNPCLGYGCGVVFKVSPSANGKWAETVLHKFHGWTDGFYPYDGLIFDADGNLFGTTSYGGVVFKLTPGAEGKWTEIVLHTFIGNDGWFPYAGLIFDTSGNLYGTTLLGGESNNCQSEFGSGCGVVFEILQ